jgi:hypothetical protein
MTPRKTGERDLQDLASISALPDFRRLMQAACLRLGQLLNQTELGRDVGLPQPTVHRWLNLLETSYLLVRLPAYAVNRTKRLVKSPRIFWGDTGVALHLGATAPAGAHLENLVLHDLLAWRDAQVDRVELAYWRTTIGEEVDFVIEVGGTLLPIEVKATSKPRLADCAHLRWPISAMDNERAYFPMQKLAKIRPSRSSLVKSPVISARASWASRSSSATSSPAWRSVSWRRASSAWRRARASASRWRARAETVPAPGVA